MQDKTKIDDGGPAFPFGQVSETTGLPINGYHNDGMSLRDYFATHLMTGLLASDAHPDIVVESLMDNEGKMLRRARFAYALADCMLKARKL